jgi:fructan beta-fructosidase
MLALALSWSSCQADGIVSTTSPTYQEPHRPQLHFSPPANWMNDPNGMVFFEGEYHLFYQYYPDSTVWGPMHWGHAVSTDLVHWDHLPIALAPDEQGYIFSGSAVVDWDNRSGFGKDGLPPLVAIFTYHDPDGAAADTDNFQTQALAYSHDQGRTWNKYAENPVLANPGIKDFRDPKVIWERDSKQWLMVLAVGDHVNFYGSPDLKSWRYLSSFGTRLGAHGGVWECPDFFPLMIDDTGAQRWVLLVSINPGAPNGGSGTQYFVGHFERNRFKLDAEFAANLNRMTDSVKAVWLDYGRDNYAGVTWSDIPSESDRRVFLGWMSNWDYAQVVPTAPWRSAMTLARELNLRSTRVGPRLTQAFVPELEELRGEAIAHELPREVAQATPLPADPRRLEVILEAAVRQDSSTLVGLRLSNAAGESYEIGYSAAKHAYFSDRRRAGATDFAAAFGTEVHYAPAHARGTLVSMHLVFDESSVELIADDGFTCLTDLYFPSQSFTQLELLVEGEPIELQRLELYPLQSIW